MKVKWCWLLGHRMNLTKWKVEGQFRRFTRFCTRDECNYRTEGLQ